MGSCSMTAWTRKELEEVLEKMAANGELSKTVKWGPEGPIIAYYLTDEQAKKFLETTVISQEQEQEKSVK